MKLPRNDAARRMRRFSKEEVLKAAQQVDPQKLAQVDRDGEPYQISEPTK